MEENVGTTASDINSEELAACKNDHIIVPRKKRICLVGAASDDPALGIAAQQFGVPVLKSQTGLEYVDDYSFRTYFILKKFEGSEYDQLHKSDHRILGPTALLQLAEKKEMLPSINRPMYTQAMLGTIVVFTGFRDKDVLTRLVDMIHHMGGSVRKEIGNKVTHLIANCCGSKKYRYAVTFRVPIMSINWVNALWETKDDVTSFSNSEEMINTYKLKPFFGARVCFFGFPEEEKSHMCEVLHQQGGEATEITDPNCTHVVTNLGKRRYKITDSARKSLPYYQLLNDLVSFELSFDPSPRTYQRGKSRNSLPYSFAYFDPYTNSIPSIPKSIHSRSLKTASKSDLGFFRDVTNHDSSTKVCEFVDKMEYDRMSVQESLMNQNSEILNQNTLNQDSDAIKNDGATGKSKVQNVAKVEYDNMSIQESSTSQNQDSSTTLTKISKVEKTEYDRMSIQEISTSLNSDDKDSVDPKNNEAAKEPKVQSEACDVIDKSEYDRMSVQNSNGCVQMEYDRMSILEVDFEESMELIFVEEEFTDGMEFYQWFPSPNDNSLGDSMDLYPWFSVPKSTLDKSTISVPEKQIYESSARVSDCRKIITPRRCKTPPSYLSPYVRKRGLETRRFSCNLDNPPTGVTLIRRKSLKAITKVVTKIGEIVFPSSFRQFRVSPKQDVKEQDSYKQLPQTPMARPRGGSFMSPSDVFKEIKEKLKLSVVDESTVNALPDLASKKPLIVKAEWFWTSVQNEGAADEKEYLFEDYLESITSPVSSVRRDSQAATPTTASTRRKRKRLAETFSSLVQNSADSPALHKRRSSISDAGHLSVSGSFLDCTASPDKQLDDIPEVEAVHADSRENLSRRHRIFLELVQTESNYVGILSTIMILFKSPLEDKIGTSEQLLNRIEVDSIFGNFPRIYEVHKNMLTELRHSATHWSEENSIGNIVLKYAPRLKETYPDYVNFFEQRKVELENCDREKPRFHAFLKICQTKPECGRQSLKELLIKPVQRLPSLKLLLDELVKHTNKGNADFNALERSINSIKEVLTLINEEKRKTEGQIAIFDIFNEIENCPAQLVSSHRMFIGKCDVQELSEGLSGRGDHLVLFLFTDMLEICKKRSKAFNSMKSPNTLGGGTHTVKMSSGKPYKHIKMLSLTTVKKVYDIRETEECRKVFALLVRSNQELKDKLYSFTITDEEVSSKTKYLKSLCRQMADTVCQTDADKFLISLDSHQLEIDTSDVALGTLSKAFKSLFHNFYLEYMDPYVFLLNSMCETTLHVPLPFASRTRMKVGRALSFNKTPSKLKHAMSSMMSPFGSTQSLTPASQQLAQMRLASCTNINEIHHNGGTSSPTSRDDVLVAPMSVQPTRKAKCSTLSIASLRRNVSAEKMDTKSDL